MKVSRELLQRGSLVDAVLATRDHALVSDRWVAGEYPELIDRARGAHLWDVDGNQYVDLLLAFGAILLGHADVDVNAAACSELQRGSVTGLVKRQQVELAEKLVEIIPGTEMVTFLKTGSDATSAAVRLARSFTGRDRVVLTGYHGWHDWCAQTPDGVPSGVRADSIWTPFGDVDRLRTLMSDVGREVACIVTVPTATRPTTKRTLAQDADFLHEVRRLCDFHGAILVLDEMRTGLRLALGGAQEAHDLRADLTTFGKAIANGYELSVVTGRADVLAELARVHITGTHFTNSAPMAAALATIDKVQRVDLRRLWNAGQRVQDALADCGRRSGIPLLTLGLAVMPDVAFDYQDAALAAAAKEAFCVGLIRRGVFVPPNHHWFLALATSGADLDRVVDASEATLSEMSRTFPSLR